MRGENMKKERKNEVDFMESSHKPNSIEVSRTAKREYTWKIKVYYSHIWTRTLNEIEAIDRDLRKRFTPNDGSDSI